jgi:hypothetical protein
MNPRCLRSFSLFLALAALVCVLRASAAGPHELSPPGLADGSGVWANVWNYPSGDLDSYCSNLRAHGVRNLFIQTTRSNMPAIAHAPELGGLVDACHKHKIRVIGWAYLELNDPIGDAEKMLAAARFQSPTGERLDAIAPDLEKNLTQSRVEQFSKHLRQALGPNYPLIAVLYSPLNHYKEVSSIPWTTIAQYYDVVAPMNYWNSKKQKLNAYDYTLATVRVIRELCGRPDLEIHVIGDAMGTSHEALLQFMKACKHSEATSASIYPNQQPTAEQLAALNHYSEYFGPNARFRLAAFREMVKCGAVPCDAKVDPTQPISRADFCRMVAHRMHTAAPLTESGAQAPVYPQEALTMLAHLVDSHHTDKGKGRRADRWFAAPAMAEAPMAATQSDRPLNYLDASMMVLQASSALK